jgi:isopenicillin N synthase-like dioxygenase
MGNDNLIQEYYVEPANVPVVDFQSLISTDRPQRQLAVKQLDSALQEYGFVYITNHSIAQEKVDEAFKWVI